MVSMIWEVLGREVGNKAEESPRLNKSLSFCVWLALALLFRQCTAHLHVIKVKLKTGNSESGVHTRHIVVRENRMVFWPPGERRGV